MSKQGDVKDVELSLLNCDERTRFQVNPVNNRENEIIIRVNGVEDFPSDDEVQTFSDKTRLSTEYAKSFRHLTREALPRLDNYRNILSLQAANRPTLDELHNATLTNKNQTNATSKIKEVIRGEQVKFGWIQGVLVRCLLNIWGVMLFLRLTWVVAQTGIVQAMILILTATVVTSITALSMSAICTNGVIKGGGTYYMISRSLGPEFGGSIGLIFSLANAVACSMYVVGFCESLNDLFRKFDFSIVDGGIQDVRIIGCFTIVFLTTIVIVGMEWEAKAQIGLLIILLVAIADFFLGSIIGPTNDSAKAKGFVGFSWDTLQENLHPDYRFSGDVQHNFFTVFAVFFPAATGILAGANISGDLKDPQGAIPKGTLLAILITTTCYILMALISGATMLRDATGNTDDYINGTVPYCEPGECPFGLHNNFQVVELISWVGPIIYAGCFAATLSSALASLVSAPKVFQALCKDKLYPKIEWFGKGYGPNDEPLRGYVLTFVIAVAFILIGELNLIAPLISNFFLAAYTLINFSTFHASLAKPVGWRPTFRYYNMWLSLIGSILCVLVMFLISWWTALLTLATVLSLYLVVTYRKPDVNWGSTTQAQIYKNALQSVQQLNWVEEHVKNYRPQILVLSGMPSSRPALVDLASLFTKNLSMMICGHIVEEQLHQRVRNIMTYKAQSWLKAHKMKSFYTQVDGMTFIEGSSSLLKASGIGKLRPNIVLMGHKSNWQTCDRIDLQRYFETLHNAFDLYYAVGILRLQSGLDVGKEEENLQNNESAESLYASHSYNHLSEASSCSDISIPATPISRVDQVNDNPQPSRNQFLKKKVPKSITGSISEGLAEDDQQKSKIGKLFQFRKKQRSGGTIDVWWLYDDGGLTLLLPYILSTRQNWNHCKLRVFALANKRDELEIEHRNMASLLAKFRIDYTDLQIVSDITNKPSSATQHYFDSLIGGFRSNNQQDGFEISEAELLAVKEKSNRHMRLRELLNEHSSCANFIVMTLPIPRKNIVSAPLYLAWIELLTKDMPPILLVRGNQTSVLTFYS